MPGVAEPAVDRVAAELDDDLIALRREIHRWPELSGEEERTAALAADRLRSAGLAVTTGVGGHGVVAVVDGAAAGPTVAYRADLDAIDTGELFDGEFASRLPGVGHLCGHDLHTAVGVGIAQLLGRLRHRLRGRVVVLFQPAEETLTGARAMIEAGVLERTAPQEIYALHCGQLPVGGFGVMPGAGLPGQDRFRITLPAPATDRLVAELDGLSTVRFPRTPEQSRQLAEDLRDPTGPLARFVVVAPGTIADGEWTQVRGGVRAWPDGRYPEIRDELRRRADAVGGRAEFPAPPFPAMVCHPELSEAAAAYLRAAAGPAAVTMLAASYPFNSEDFALFLRRVPGAMFYLGVADPAAGITGIPHTPEFTADERAIGVGVRAMAGFLASRLDALAR